MSTGPGIVQKMQRHNEHARDRTKRKDGGQNEVSQRTSNRHTSNCSTRADLKEIIRPKEEARPLQSDEQGPNPVEELRWRINQLEKEKLELTSKSNQQASCYEAQLARCRALLEKGEAQRQTLEYELALVKRDATAQNNRSKDKLTELIKFNQKLEGLSAELRQRASDLQKALELTQHARDEDERGLRAELRERDHVIHSISAEKEQLQEEKVHLETLLQEQKDTLQDVKDRMDRLERERQRHVEELRVKASELKRGADREKKMKKELEAAMQKIQTLEQGVESERVAHLESKFSAEVIQVRLRDLEAALSVEKRNHAEATSDLQLLKQKFGDVEKAHMLERERADNSQHTLQQLEKEYLSTKAELIGQLDKTKASSAQLSGQLEQVKAESANLIGQLEQEKMKSANLVGQLEQEKMKSADVIGQLEEEKTKTATVICQLEQEKAEVAKLLLRLQKLESLQTESTQELSLVHQRNVFLEEAHERLLKEFVQLLEHYNHQGAPPINTTDDGDKLNLSALMDMLRRTLHHCHTELKDLLKVVDVLKKESKEKEKLINEQKRHVQECEMRTVRVTDEAEHLRASLGNAKAAAERAQSELRSVTHCYEQEKERLAHTKTQMHTLTQQHDKQQQERLAFLHSLYQQLIAGSVFVTPAQSMMGSFSWAELSTILQEHADMLISDLNSANQKISSLESVCDGKAEALKSVCEQLKQREERWIKEREELDVQHTRLINKLHARAQDLRRCLDKTEESLRTSERARSALQQEANRLQDLVRRCRGDDRSLLVACALLAGCVCALHRRVCALVYQKAALCRRSHWAESLERDAGALLHALGDGGVKEHVRLRGALWRFRVCVITVMGALRLRMLLRTSNTLFRLAGGLCVSRLRLREEEEENKGMMMLKSSELRVIIHSSMQEMQKELQNTEDSECLRTAARSSFTKLMEKLLPEMHSDCKGCYGDVGSLSQQLSRGLNKLRKTHRLPPRHDTNKLILSALQQHFLLYTQRLHSTEVERRDLRIELACLRRGNTKKRGQPKDDAHSDSKDETHNACVPVEQFRSVWTELSSALQREQQAQGLLHEQALQLREFSLTMEIHTREQLEKDQTLAQAVQSLSEAKAQLKRKDQSLHLLGKRLNQSDQEKLHLQESITKAENTLQTVARAKECLSSYIKSVEHNLREHRDHLVISRSTSSRKDFNLHLPTVSMDTPGPERNTEGPELTACKALVHSFTEVYELMCCKMASLEREISSYQSHITALKAELHDACLRENQCYVFGSDDPPAPILKADVHCGTPACLEALVTLKDTPKIERPVQKSLPRKKSKSVKKPTKVTNHKGVSKSLN